MKKLGIKEQIFIAVALSVLIVVLCGVILWKPQIDRISTYQKQQQEQDSLLSKKQAELTSLKLAKKEAPKNEAESLVLNKSMPEEEDIPSLVVDMEETAIQSNVKLLKFEFSEPSVLSTYSYIDFKGEAVGSYFNLADYLYNLSQMPRQVKIKSLVFEVSEEGYPLINVKVDYRTYVYTTSSPVSGSSGAVGATGQTSQTSSTSSTASSTGGNSQ